MKNYLLTLKKKACLVTLLLLNVMNLYAQNTADSDLSNTADSNKNWREGWWLPALVILLILVVFFVYRRKKRSA